MIDDLFMIREGRFSLDPGAIFGTIPEPIWSRVIRRNAMGRIDSDANVFVLSGNGNYSIIDSGVGNIGDPRFREIFQISSLVDLREKLDENFGISNLRRILHTHVHFDHCGNDLALVRGNDSRIIMQKKEVANYRKPNLFTKVSYVRKSMPPGRVLEIDGVTRIGPDARILAVGGHTTGHQVIEFSIRGRKYLHFGDIIPSSFHIRPNYIPAIDTNPLDTLNLKLKLIRKAIREKSVCIFNHDPVTPAGILSGSELKPDLTPFDLAKV